MSRDVEVPVAVNDVAAQRVSGLDSCNKGRSRRCGKCLKELRHA